MDIQTSCYLPEKQINVVIKTLTFLFLMKPLWYDYSFESSRRDNSNEWSHHRVKWWNNKVIV